eukprot:scaffold45033_cov32-Tisochrysis_lutea.AAC.2
MSPTLRALSALDEERAAEVTEGLHVAIRRVFGEAAAYSVLDDLTALGHARRRAIGVKMATEKEAAAAAESLTEYYAMLCALARPYSKEAEEVLGDAMPPLPFGWKSSIDGAAEVAKSPKLVLERAAILYNLAVAHWSRGMLLPKADVEQIKTAARHFQIASGEHSTYLREHHLMLLRHGRPTLAPPARLSSLVFLHMRLYRLGHRPPRRYPR